MNHLRRRFVHRIGGREVQTAVLEHLLPELDVRAFHADHDWHRHAELPDRRDHPLGEDVAAQDATEDVDEHRLHALVRHQDLERVADLLGVGAAAYVQKVCRLPARQLDDVHRRHGEARAVDHAPDGAIELDVVQRELRRLDLERRLLSHVAQRLDLGMAIERVVVEVHLGVERQETAVIGHDERIDLDEGGVGCLERVVDGVHELGGLRDLGALEAERERELARLKRSKTGARVNVFLEDALGRLVRDFLDVDAAVLAGHQHWLLGRAVENNAQIELARNAEALLHEDTLDHLALRAGLVGDQAHPDHGGRGRRGGVRALHDLDPATLAAAAGVDLRLDDHRSAAETDGYRLRVGCIEHDFALGHRHAVCREDRLGLIFVDFHEALQV